MHSSIIDALMSRAMLWCDCAGVADVGEFFLYGLIFLHMRDACLRVLSGGVFPECPMRRCAMMQAARAQPPYRFFVLYIPRRWHAPGGPVRPGSSGGGATTH